MVVSTTLRDTATGLRIAINPVEANFGADDQIRVGPIVDAHGQGVNVSVDPNRSVNTFALVPLESSTVGQAVIDRLDQVLVDAEGVADGNIIRVVGVQNVALDDVLQAVADCVISDQRVHVPLLNAIEAGFAETAGHGGVNQGQVVGNAERQAAQE